MRYVSIPSFFHELFGKKQILSELLMVIVFTVGATAFMAWQNVSVWQNYSFIQNVVLWLLYLDITGGVIANLTHGTNSHYNAHPKGRWIFIAIHVQPLLLAFVLSSSMSIAIGVWAYTIVSASLINLLRSRRDHRTLAGVLMTGGLIALYSVGSTLPPLIVVLYALYLIKVIFSFAVNHTMEVKGD